MTNLYLEKIAAKTSEGNGVSTGLKVLGGSAVVGSAVLSGLGAGALLKSKKLSRDILSSRTRLAEFSQNSAARKDRMYPLMTYLADRASASRKVMNAAALEIPEAGSKIHISRAEQKYLAAKYAHNKDRLRFKNYSDARSSILMKESIVNSRVNAHIKGLQDKKQSYQATAQRHLLDALAAGGVGYGLITGGNTYGHSRK